MKIPNVTIPTQTIQNNVFFCFANCNVSNRSDVSMHAPAKW